MDEQDGMLDFQELRAKFQDKEFLLWPPKNKPAVPEKPKVISPPLSPTHHLPSGARPSLLTSINQALESKTVNTPRVVFKGEKKDNKMLLIQNNSKVKEKSDWRPKESKEKTKESKEKLNENSSDHKEKNGKKLPIFRTQKENTSELVPASPPLKAKTQRKKNILGFKKSSKKDTEATSAESILDSTTGDIAGPALMIPVVFDANNTPQESIYSVPKQVLPKITIPESSAAVDLTTLSPIPEPPEFSPPPAIIPVVPVFTIPALKSETPPQIENPAVPVSNLPSQNKIAPIPPIVAPSRPLVAPPPPPVSARSPQIIVAPSPSHIMAPSPQSTAPPSSPPRTAPSPRAMPPPPLSFAISDSLSEASARSSSPSDLQVAAGSDVEVTHPTAEDAMDSLSLKPERPVSALSALERAEDMSTGKRTPPSDQRILSALENTRRKAASPLSSHTPPPEDFPSHLDPAPTDVVFSPIDYEGKKPSSPEAYGTDHRTASPVLQNVTVERSNLPLELLLVPPPPTIQVVPETQGPAPENPDRPLFVNLSEFIPPPPLIPEEIRVPPEFSEPDATDVPEFDDLTDAYSPELPVSECGNEDLTGPDVPDEPNQSKIISNGITDSETKVYTETAYGDDQDNPPQKQPFQAVQDHSTPKENPQTLYQSSMNDSNENLYEAVRLSSGKKKEKGNSGKKRKGTLKNPYAENARETVQEKPKTIRFGRSEKKQTSAKPDEKELKKKEKQRLEKEKKELKEKQERERKEQKEREKKENEMKKKFCVTGQEEAMYQAKVNVTTKGSKNDLPVKNGDVISIIRTTKCPKGKWLARDSSNTYGYVSVDHLEMDFREMLEVGKKTPRNSTITEAETTTDGRVLNHFSHSAESFTDDSEEWACEDDDSFSPAPETSHQLPGSHTRTFSMPETGNKDLAINHQYSHSDMCDSSQIQARQEALQKLATFLRSSKSLDPAPVEPEPERSSSPVQEEAVSEPQISSTQKTEFDPTAIILPPPDMYADFMLDSPLHSEPIKNLPC
ncbi:titin isoform X1 [Girardinichthys multiradiatus]|uniref:titin isoform X1 n=1 Tax=Girardinichthys multiradiatus TaxID=208333 RepID=UPI001FAC2307|nr:titin isoform X1 [Girardinichthys multiradiatus]